MKKNKAAFHLDRAALWQTRYLLHATGGKPGRAANAKRRYNYHMQQFARTITAAPGKQLLLIP